MAVAASTPTAVLQKNGMIGLVKQMTVTLTCDHRHIYGADAAK
jgi:pyruvate dehydrogenase E2 component (dihydrolipoamide acetyltransferase)